MNKDNYVVIMAGGIGSRFWPLSKSRLPKQFIDILGVGETLIQQTYNRLSKIFFAENIFIVTNQQYINLCLDQLPKIPKENILCEPVMRNTAPCIAYASFKINSINNNANIMIAASDHIILDEQSFINVVKKCLVIVSENKILLTLGITPSRPETGYGYIQFTDDLLHNNPDIKKVKTFTEKPDQELALNFLDSGDFLWNSGMFFWNVNTICLSFRKYLRDIYDVFYEGQEFYNTDKEQEYLSSVFPTCKNISIDYGIMEKSEDVYVCPTNFGWSDLCTLGSLYNHLGLDTNKNAVLGNQVMLYNASNNIINMPNDKLVVIQGLNGYIVVEDEGTLLICKKEDEQEIKKFVSDLRKSDMKDKI